MATRFYLSSTQAPPVSPAYRGSWTRVAEALRRRMSPTKDSSAITDLWSGGNVNLGADESFLTVQLVSDPMPAGISFLVTDAVKMSVLCAESSTTDNINRAPTMIYVVSADGATLRATLLAWGHHGPSTTEWTYHGGAPYNGKSRLPLDGDTVGAYTTQAGDRLVVELGGQVSGAGGTTVQGLQWMGNAAASDLDYSEIDTGKDNPWFEIDTDITFLGTPAPAICTPSSGAQGTTLDVVITGTDLAAVTAATFGTNITVNSIVIDSDLQITVNITTSAVLETVDVVLTNPAGTGTLAGGFEVVPNPPTISSVSPSSGLQGDL